MVFWRRAAPAEETDVADAESVPPPGAAHGVTGVSVTAVPAAPLVPTVVQTSAAAPTALADVAIHPAPPPRRAPTTTTMPLSRSEDAGNNQFSQSAVASSASRSSGPGSTTSTTDSELDLRVLSARAAEDFSIGRWAKFFTRYHFIYIFLLVLCFIFYGSSVAALIISVSLLELNIIATIVFAAVLGGQLLSSLPMWITLLFWRACPPMEGTIGVDAHGRLPSVDVVITVYKEETEIIVGTLLATQRLEYDSSRLHIYLLDDGRRPELADIVREMGASGALRHPLTYLTRESNAGAKGGNLNHWLRASAEMAGEFFVTLDADMQPFPDALAILFGHWYGYDRATRERLAFVQAPQFFRQRKPGGFRDSFDVCLMFFCKTLNPSMNRFGCVIYVGCCALWRRDAIESVNGFHEGHATEDAVTGCTVHRTHVPGTNTTWLSKYLSVPIAAGLSPPTLPALLDQRLRWYLGLIQMFVHHRGYLFASRLTLMQRIAYLGSAGNWIAGIVNFLALLAGTVTIFAMIIVQAAAGDLDNSRFAWAFWFSTFACFITFFAWLLLPGAGWVAKIRGSQMSYMYTSTFIAAIFKYFGVNIAVQKTAADVDDERRVWHPLMWINVFALVIVFGVGGVAIWQVVNTPGKKETGPILQIAVYLGVWAFLHWPLWLALVGYRAKEDDFYAKEAEGLPDYTDVAVNKLVNQTRRRTMGSVAGGDGTAGSEYTRYSIRHGTMSERSFEEVRDMLDEYRRKKRESTASNPVSPPV